MIKHIKRHVDRLFEGKPSTPEIRQLHDEMLYSMTETYRQCIANNMDRYAAYDIAIQSCDSMKVMLEELALSATSMGNGFFDNPPQNVSAPNQTKSHDFPKVSSVLNSVATIAVIIGIAGFVILNTSSFEILSWIFLTVAAECFFIVHYISQVFKIKGDSNPDKEPRMIKKIRNGCICLLWTIEISIVMFVGNIHSGLEDYLLLIILMGIAINVGLNCVAKIITLQRQPVVDKYKINKSAKRSVSAMLWIISFGVLTLDVILSSTGLFFGTIALTAAIQVAINLIFKLHKL